MLSVAFWDYDTQKDTAQVLNVMLRDLLETSSFCNMLNWHYYIDTHRP